MNADATKGPAHLTLVRVVVGFAALLSTIILSTSSFALGTAEQRAACTNDVMRLCFTAALSGDNAIVSCMMQNHDKISLRCKKTLPPL
jgi:hypothetical protein